MSAGLVRNILSKHCFRFRLSQPQMRIPRRCNSYDGDGKTSVTILNHEIDSPLMVDSYHQTGFTLNNGMAVVGPIALFPKTVLAWDVQSARDISVDSLSLFLIMEPKLDILVIGVGDKSNQVDPNVLDLIRKKGISLEILSTEHACTTFNFLNVERRAVAAALIPPRATKLFANVEEETRRRKENSRDDEEPAKLNG